MAKPAEKLAESLETLHEVQKRRGAAIRSRDLSRTHRERLVSKGFLKEVMKGWYVHSRPDEDAGESTTWYASYWDFCAAYLNDRLGTKWSLSPEQSLLLHAENRAVPQQLLVRTPKGGNKPVALPHGTSLFEVRAALPESKQTIEKNGLRLFSVPAALVAAGPGIFRQYPTDIRVVLSMVKDASQVLAILLEGGHSVIAGRLAGAFRNTGNKKIADEIIKTMQAADYKINEEDPFAAPAPFTISSRERSPYVNRIRLMWRAMREDISGRFPAPQGNPDNIDKYLAHVDEIYITDAYHSLSIEGYRVTPELIERVRSGDWDPDNFEEDRERRDALAARGYWQAFNVVRKSVAKVLKGENAGSVVASDYSDWYRELFAPSVTAGILKPSDLAGYRNDQVFIRRSMHVPPHYEAVRDCMPAFFDLLREETDTAVRVVLGHFVLVYIHPYMDGNGRMARFLMNVMLASGGYTWTVTPVEQRRTYMAALEEASTKQNIIPFSEFLAGLVSIG